MKKVLLAGITSAMLSVSCSTLSRGAEAQKKRVDFNQLKGDWQLSSVDYDKSFKIKPFDEGIDISCFIGSQWKLVPNNNKGSYTINGMGDCPSVVQSIVFDVLNDKTFQFKKIAEGTKAKHNTFGYQLTLVEQNQNHFMLQQNILFERKTIPVTYHFNKISK